MMTMHKSVLVLVLGIVLFAFAAWLHLSGSPARQVSDASVLRIRGGACASHCKSYNICTSENPCPGRTAQNCSAYPYRMGTGLASFACTGAPAQWCNVGTPRACWLWYNCVWVTACERQADPYDASSANSQCASG